MRCIHRGFPEEELRIRGEAFLRVGKADLRTNNAHRFVRALEMDFLPGLAPRKGKA